MIPLPADDIHTCPRCRGTGTWPPSRIMSDLSDRMKFSPYRCDWCEGYGALTRAEMYQHLAAQKKRRLRVERLTPEERRRVTKEGLDR
jgi:hypothetical protein